MTPNLVAPDKSSAPVPKISWYIWRLSLIVGFGGFLFGIDTAVVSGAISMIAKQFALGVDMEGWVVSSTVLGCVAGTVSSGWLADRFGRVPALRLAAVLFLVSTLGSAQAGAFAYAEEQPTKAAPTDKLAEVFTNPPDSARPWVYWYFLDGHLKREGMKADLEAMKKAGIGGALFLETAPFGVSPGPVKCNSPEWQDLVVEAMKDCDRLGLEFSLGTGPGWAGAGGPWITPDNAMQHLVESTTNVQGGQHVEVVLPKPKPRTPIRQIPANMWKQWQEYYRDEKVIAYPKPSTAYTLPDSDEKAIYQRDSFSSLKSTKAYILEDPTVIPSETCIDPKKVIDLTNKMTPDGKLSWDAPAGQWIVMRWGRTLTGMAATVAPDCAAGFDSGKFETSSIDQQYANFIEPLLKKLGGQHHPGRGWTMLHSDSWEQSSQNWSPTFPLEFKKRRGYDPIPWLPAMAGQIVGNVSFTERFLWDFRQTAQDLVIDNHINRLKSLGAKSGLKLTIEPYDLNPTSDLVLGSEADVPSAEFWSEGYGADTIFSVFEASSCAHTTGRKVVQAEAFTSSEDAWRQHPGNMKNQGDWAFCAGISRFCFHRFSAQPEANPKPPGVPWGPFGVHWDRTQTWWEMAPGYHTYLTRCQALLQNGLPVADILFLDAEGAPNVFRPPTSALLAGLPDRKGYNFDGCAPGVLIKSASVKDGRIVFPDGMSYRLLVLPQRDTMTPELARKVQSLVEAGALVYGPLPTRSPSLKNYPACDQEVVRISNNLANSKRMIVDQTPVVKATPNPLFDAKWIWSKEEGNPLSSAPAGTRYFQYAFDLDKPVKSIPCVITADDRFELTVNGHKVGTGDNPRKEFKFEIGSLLKVGSNLIQVTVQNEKAGPAGLIAAITATLDGGKKLEIYTNKNWQVGTDPDKVMTQAKEIGAAWTWYWYLVDPQSCPNLYPDYSVLAKLLSDQGVVPDFQSDGDLRYFHRVDGDIDYYFVGNRMPTDQTANVSFRVSGKQPELWDPLTGERRLLPEFSESNGVTTIPMRFAPTQSFFVVFGPKVAGREANGGKNFPDLTPVATLDGAWQVAFEAEKGGPAGKLQFDKLDDWVQRPEKELKFYSGTAVYEKTFDLPTPPRGPCKLDLGKVAVMAEVKLNGKNLGIVWCPPWQVDIPAGVLAGKGNQLEIKVANLWCNRVISDQSLPPQERISDLGGSNMGKVFAGSGRAFQLPGGLLGPVRLVSKTP